MLYLTRADVEAVDLEMPEIIETLSKLFSEKGRGEIEMPPKPGIHPRQDASIRAMLAYIPSLDAAGVKWISGYGLNFQKGLPNINGAILLNDPETGVPVALMDCTWITAQRTGAATAVAANHLARKDSSTLAMIACGEQGRTNLEALATCFELTKVNAFDINFEKAQQFAKEMQAKFDIEVEALENLKTAVSSSDIVVTAGPILMEPKPLIEPGWLPPGAFACPLDFDSYFQPEAFAEADRLVTDDIAQLEYFREYGYFKETPTTDSDLGHIAAALVGGRANDEQKIIAINLGIAMHDIAVASIVYERAIEMGIGSILPDIRDVDGDIAQTLRGDDGRGTHA